MRHSLRPGNQLGTFNIPWPRAAGQEEGRAPGSVSHVHLKTWLSRWSSRPTGSPPWTEASLGAPRALQLLVPVALPPLGQHRMRQGLLHSQVTPGDQPPAASAAGCQGPPAPRGRQTPGRVVLRPSSGLSTALGASLRALRTISEPGQAGLTSGHLASAQLQKVLLLFQKKGFHLQQESTGAGNQAHVIRPAPSQTRAWQVHLPSGSSAQLPVDVTNSPGPRCLSACPPVSPPTSHPSAHPGGSTCRTSQNLLLPHAPRPNLGQTTPALPLMAVVPCCACTSSLLSTHHSRTTSAHILLCSTPSVATLQAKPGPARP